MEIGETLHDHDQKPLESRFAQLVCSTDRVYVMCGQVHGAVFVSRRLESCGHTISRSNSARNDAWRSCGRRAADQTERDLVVIEDTHTPRTGQVRDENYTDDGAAKKRARSTIS